MKRWQADKIVPADARQKLWEAFRTGRDGKAPTEAEFDLVVCWAADHLKDGDHLAKGLLRAAMDGWLNITGFDRREGPLFQISALGQADVENRLLLQPEHREMIRRLDAAHGTKTKLPPVPYEPDEDDAISG
jgi:hypothetical protein